MSCPYCGYCPTCGRSNGHGQYYQPYPYTYTYPWTSGYISTTEAPMGNTVTLTPTAGSVPSPTLYRQECDHTKPNTK